MDLDGSVSYQVSDALKDRHPYSRKGDAKAQGGVSGSNGFGIGGLQDSIRKVSDEGQPVAAKEQALQHLLRHLSNCETKARLLSHGILDTLKFAASPPGKHSVTCDKLVCQALKQLAALPTSMHALAEQGCIDLAVSILDEQTDTTASLAACNALGQMAETWDGRALLLGLELPDGFGTPSPQDAAAVNEQAEASEALAKRLVAALVAKVRSKDRSLLLSALKCLGNITTVERGLHLALCESIFRDINKVLEELTSSGDEWVFDDSAVEVIYQAATVVCNIALDDFGKDRAMEVPLVPQTLGTILYESVKYPNKVLRVKAATTGAIAALYVRAQTKHTCLQPLHVPPQHEEGFEVNLAYLLVKLLKQANAIYHPIRGAAKAGTTPPGASPEELQCSASVVTNCNQAIRLLAELPSARKRVTSLLEKEPLTLKRQIFYSTQFEAEFLGPNFKAF